MCNPAVACYADSMLSLTKPTIPDPLPPDIADTVLTQLAFTIETDWTGGDTPTPGLASAGGYRVAPEFLGEVVERSEVIGEVSDEHDCTVTEYMCNVAGHLYTFTASRGYIDDLDPDEVGAELSPVEIVAAQGWVVMSSAKAQARARSGVERIAEERARQQAKRSVEHDAGHSRGEMSVCAAELAVHDTDEELTSYAQPRDQWGLVAKHGHDRLRSLTIAGALIAAEIDRELARGEV
jgi:hypothetical protein